MLSVVMTVMILAGCADEKQSPEGGEGKDKELTIAFSFEDLETEFWVAAHEVITTTLKEEGCKVIELNCQGDANKQFEQVNDALTQEIDGIIMIPVDGDTAVTVTAAANESDVPIVIFNRPPTSDEGSNITVVCDNATTAEATVDYMVGQAKAKFDKTGKKLTPCILVGDLGDPNAIERKNGFYTAIKKEPDIFNDVVEVPTEWDAATALANLQSAVQANPEIDFIFSSSDFLFPTIQSVIEPLGKWQKIGNDNHVILGGLDGDATAGKLIDEGYVDATGVQDLFFETDAALKAIVEAAKNGETDPDEVLTDPGFALTQGNLKEKRMDMWGNAVGAEQ
jgi:ABC-type sugar transport system, periplasmic component